MKSGQQEFEAGLLAETKENKAKEKSAAVAA